MKVLLRWLRCWTLHCPGRVVSGWRGEELCIGWCCNDCGRVKYYEPTKVRRTLEGS